MTTLIKIDGEYANWIKDLSLRFRQSQIKAAIRVNSEMLRFYFSLGADIVNKKAESRWGDGFFKNLSRDLQNELPEVKGFSETNLRYAKLFYQLYNQLFTISPQDEDQLNIFQIPWSHHKYIIDKCKKDTNKALFYTTLLASLNTNYQNYSLKISKVLCQASKISKRNLEKL